MNFRISCEIKQFVVTLHLSKSFRIIDLENGNYIISVEFINSSDKTIPSILPIFEVNILCKWWTSNNLNSKTLIGNQNTEYANDDKALEFF